MSDTSALWAMGGTVLGFAGNYLVARQTAERAEKTAQRGRVHAAKHQAIVPLLHAGDAQNRKTTDRELADPYGVRPEDYADPWEKDLGFVDLRAALADVELTCTSVTTAAATRWISEVIEYAWTGAEPSNSWESRAAFVAAAHIELGIS